MASRRAVRPQGMRVNPFFSPAIQADQFLFISGQAALDSQGKVVAPGNCAEQAEHIMQQMKTTLEAAGSSLDDVVKTTTFLTDAGDYASYNYVRSKYFSEDPPASSTVIVAALVVPGLVIEVEAVAMVPGTR